ncbi:DUF6691 family protein [Salinisphaera sp. LB1]|uniref:DUF6691 family protein n=1 Tax=Salinisphaera sp. LB1 TaxID=2183911 RepID=UPI000D705A05|nr:DUF6691 family protein [Salinisphaera sp. LB1]AWN16571.1 gene II anc x protein [Salinisphaera sp. LB1]
MKQHLIAIAAGLVFGFGLCLSHMADPDKVLAFLDLVGGWDPSLALVMGGALLVTVPAFAVLRGWRRPWADTAMHWPTATDIDHRLALGAALFGIGWGLAGYCPGPALAALTFNPHEALIFVAALVIGGRVAGWRAR